MALIVACFLMSIIIAKIKIYDNTRNTDSQGRSDV